VCEWLDKGGVEEGNEELSHENMREDEGSIQLQLQQQCTHSLYICTFSPSSLSPSSTTSAAFSCRLALVFCRLVRLRVGCDELSKQRE
jgi:hypothetical protein